MFRTEEKGKYCPPPTTNEKYVQNTLLLSDIAFKALKEVMVLGFDLYLI